MMTGWRVQVRRVPRQSPSLSVTRCWSSLEVGTPTTSSAGENWSPITQIPSEILVTKTPHTQPPKAATILFYFPARDLKNCQEKISSACDVQPFRDRPGGGVRYNNLVSALILDQSFSSLDECPGFLENYKTEIDKCTKADVCDSCTCWTGRICLSFRRY